jgi:hypothetical protein
MSDIFCVNYSTRNGRLCTTVFFRNNTVVCTEEDGNGITYVYADSATPEERKQAIDLVLQQRKLRSLEALSRK